MKGNDRGGQHGRREGAGGGACHPALRGRVREHAGAARAARRVGRERDNVGRGGPALPGDREQQERLPGAQPRHVRGHARPRSPGRGPPA